MNTDRQEKGYKKLLVGKAWEYLYENFHKFNDTNKIKVALELCKKDLPTKMEGELTTKVVMDKVEKDGKPMEHKVGS